MSKVYETLKKKNDTSVEVYPNIERQNIPNGAINTAKLEDGAVNYSKLNDALRDDIDNFNNIYDAEDDKISVADIDVTDDIRCSNVYASNSVYVTDDIRCSNVYASNSVYATDSVNADNVKANTYFDSDDDELKVMVRHCLQMNLVNYVDPSDIRQLAICFTSTHKEAFTTFSELVDEFSKMVYHPVADVGYDYMGYISSVDTGIGQISIYCWSGTQPEEIDFQASDSITDTVYPI